VALGIPVIDASAEAARPAIEGTAIEGPEAG
jgi:hypothetical protein